MTETENIYFYEVPTEDGGPVNYAGTLNQFFGLVAERGAAFNERDAESELDRRRALPEEDDDRLTEHDQVFPADLIGVWWNSYDPDPRARSPLASEEIIRAFEGGVR